MPEKTMIYSGLSISDGIAVGPVFIFRQKKSHDAASYSRLETPAEGERYLQAKADTLIEIETLKSSAVTAESLAVLDAHIEILKDVAIEEEILDLISFGESAFSSISTVYSQYESIMSSLEDERMRERMMDLSDVKNRLLSVLLGEDRRSLTEIAVPSIIVADNLLPSDTVGLDPEMVKAVITESGGYTSHSAILSRSLGIPAVSGLPAITDFLNNGDIIAVDGGKGLVETSLSSERYNYYKNEIELFEMRKRIAEMYLSKAAVTADGERVLTCLNIGSDDDKELESAEYSDGVGLFRTEFLFMHSATLPDEETQYHAYSKVAERFKEKQVIIRTLDIGGDKELESMVLPQEENPFLGERAVRLCFNHPDVFLTQIRAVLRASIHGNLALMFPMISSLDDFRKAKDFVKEAMNDLDKRGEKYNPSIPIGIMIEIPSAALLADVFAAEVDFASVGTNDLCQYLTATDRMNASVAQYYQPYHPSMFRLLDYVSSQFSKEGKSLSVCGELGGENNAVLGLLSLGIRKFSMNENSLARVKELVVNADAGVFSCIREHVLKCRTADEVKAYLSQEVDILIKKGK